MTDIELIEFVKIFSLTFGIPIFAIFCIAVLTAIFVKLLNKLGLREENYNARNNSFIRK